MEQITELTYLKRITLIFLGLFAFFMLASLFEVSLYGIIHSGKTFSFSNQWILFLKYESRTYFWLNVCSYILHLVFLLIANRFVKKKLREKGTHSGIIFLAFVPLVSYVLRFIIWRKLNKQVVNDCGAKETRSDRKIKGIWVLTLISDSWTFLLPLVMPFVYLNMSITDIATASIFSHFIGRIFHLLVAIVYFLYYLEFKRILGRVTPDVLDSSLLDD